MMPSLCWPEFETVGKKQRTPNFVPPEILLQVYSLLNPRDFNTARHTCSQWMRVSLDEKLLRGMLKKAGWWDSWQRDCQKYSPFSQTVGNESLAWRMSKRFSTECVLSGRKTNVERTGFLTTSVVDFSSLSRSVPSSKPWMSPSQFFSADSNEAGHKALSKFNVSDCGNYLLVTIGRVIYVYRLLNRKIGNPTPVSSIDNGDADLVPVSCITCPLEVLSISATIDTTGSKLIIAALLCGRMGMICDFDETFAIPASRADDKSSGKGLTEKYVSRSHKHINPAAFQLDSHTVFPLDVSSRHYFLDVGSADDLPHCVAIGPGRRCVAFGCENGVELHWVDEKGNRNCRKHFPMSQPSEILRFLPKKPGDSMEMRLISSLAGPGTPGCQCHHSAHGENPSACQMHFLEDADSFAHVSSKTCSSRISLFKATQCHHYRAIPTNDGIHILFVEQRTGLLCIGSGSPVGGPKSLTRALVCVPPFGGDRPDDSKQEQVPTVFASGKDLSWGLRVVAAYQDRIVLYSVPVDVLNVLRKERERQGDSVMGDSDLARDVFLEIEAGRTHRYGYSRAENQNGDWEFLLSVSYRPTVMMWPFRIYGKEIGRMDKVVELSIQSSHGGVRVWAFGASGEARIFDVDAYSSSTHSLADIPYKSLSIGADGSLNSSRFVDRADLDSVPPQPSRKRGYSAQFSGFDGQYTQSELYGRMLDGFNSFANSASSEAVNTASGARRPSLAACFLDLQIPEPEIHEGQRAESSAA